MKDRFKEYLVEQFKTISPTQAAMEYRKRMLKQLMDRAQELQIKGIEDQEMIFNMCIEELGDFQATLQEFEHQEVGTEKKKRAASLSVVISVTAALTLVVIYLIIGGVTGIWHPTWLLLVGGAFAGIMVGLNLLAFGIKKGWLIKRVTMMVNEVLVVVFVFLLLQLVFKINGSWQAFLVLPVLIFGIDNIFAHISHCKGRWFETPIFIEILFVMLYLLLGLNLTGFWHPGWLLCLVGVLAAFIELTVYTILKNKKAQNKETKRIQSKYLKEDPRYYTDWDD